jgi:sarcosine oxidase, subunit gamma
MPERRSPLAGWSLERNGVRLRELPLLAQISVRSAASPPAPALRLGPDEWLIVGERGQETDILVRLQQAMADQRAQILDATASRTTVEISGAGATELLSKGCGLDLHPRIFLPGHAAPTILARTGVILHLIDAAPVWRVFVRASYARYLRDWLTTALAHD